MCVCVCVCVCVSVCVCVCVLFMANLCECVFFFFFSCRHMYFLVVYGIILMFSLIFPRYVPYPFQNNLSVLDVEDQVTCLNGLIDAALQSGQPTAKKPSTFDEWMVTVMGTSCCQSLLYTLSLSRQLASYYICICACFCIYGAGKTRCRFTNALSSPITLPFGFLPFLPCCPLMCR